MQRPPIRFCTGAVLLLFAVAFVSLGLERESSSGETPDKGTISGATYKNKFFGFSLSLSKGWYVLSEAEIWSRADVGINIVAADSPEGKAALQRAKGLRLVQVLLMVSQYPPDSNRLNPGFIVGAIDATAHLDKIKNGGEYLLALARRRQELKIKARMMGPIKPASIGGREFYQMDSQMLLGDWAIRERQFAAIIKGHILLLNLTGDSASSVETLTSAVRRMTF